MQRQNRYIVLKREDIEQFLTAEEKRLLCRMLRNIKEARRVRGKIPQQHYVVVGQDWPMYEATWKAIEEWVDEVL